MCRMVLLICCMAAMLFWVAYEIEHFEQVKVKCAHGQGKRQTEYERVCLQHTGVMSEEIAEVCAALEEKIKGDSPHKCANADFWETVIFMRVPWAVVGLVQRLGTWIENNIDGIKSVGLICFVIGILAVALLFRLFGIGFSSSRSNHAYFADGPQYRPPPPRAPIYEGTYYVDGRVLPASDYWEQEPGGAMIPYNRRTHRPSRSH